MTSLATIDLHIKHNLEVPFLLAKNNECLAPKEVHCPVPADSLCLLTTSRALNNMKSSITITDCYIHCTSTGIDGTLHSMKFYFNGVDHYIQRKSTAMDGRTRSSIYYQQSWSGSHQAAHHMKPLWPHSCCMQGYRSCVSIPCNYSLAHEVQSRSSISASRKPTPKEVHGPIPAHSVCMLITSSGSYYKKDMINNANCYIR
jgi:hypothetical protein